MKSHVEYIWVDDPDHLRLHGEAIIEMLNGSVQDDGMLGYGARLSDDEANGFLAFWQWQLENHSAHILFARDPLGPCAMAFMRTNSNSNYQHIADLSKGYVTPRARGGLVLLNLFSRVCARAKKLGVELLTLDTREGSRALAIWQHFGFESHGCLPDYSRFGGKSHIGHFMHQKVEKLVTFLSKKGVTHVTE